MTHITLVEPVINRIIENLGKPNKIVTNGAVAQLLIDMPLCEAVTKIKDEGVYSSAPQKVANYNGVEVYVDPHMSWGQTYICDYTGLQKGKFENVNDTLDIFSLI